MVSLVERAEEALAAGDGEAAFGQADRALGCWRGRAFEDLADIDDARPVRVRMGELRATSETLRLAAGVARGRSGWAVAEGERLVAERPVDERRWTLLVRALDMDGRRGDALAAVERARRALREGAGLDLGPELREVEGAVLGVGPGTTGGGRHARPGERTRWPGS